MGKKKGYNVAEIDFKQEEDKKTEKKESFTVQDYDGNNKRIDVTIFPIVILVLEFHDF